MTIVNKEENINNDNDSAIEFNSLTDAGRALFDALNPSETVIPEQEEEAPAAEGEPINTGEATPNTEDGGLTPAEIPIVNPDMLESLRNSIISEIQSLKQSAEAQNTGDTESNEEGSEENAVIGDDEFMEQFNSNPVQAIMTLADSIADKKVAAQMVALVDKLKPALDQSEQIAYQNKVKDTIAEFASLDDFSDAQQYFPQMVEIISAKNLPKDDIKTYIDAYKDVALADARANKGKTLDEYLADDNEVSKILENPKIKDAVINRYLEEIAKGKQPQVITNGGSASPAASPPTKFNTFDEANKAFKQHL